LPAELQRCALVADCLTELNRRALLYEIGFRCDAAGAGQTRPGDSILHSRDKHCEQEGENSQQHVSKRDVDPYEGRDEPAAFRLLFVGDVLTQVQRKTPVVRVKSEDYELQLLFRQCQSPRPQAKEER